MINTKENYSCEEFLNPFKYVKTNDLKTARTSDEYRTDNKISLLFGFMACQPL